MLAEDFNGDGHLDILLAGNSYASEFTAGWYDASHGLLLMGDGKGGFSGLSAQESGFFSQGETRDLALIRDNNNQPIVLVGRNNIELLAYKLEKIQ